ncbi:MAG: hypothetical protein M9962_14995 [Oligoflexia bacterium]|nr:hypothetical protein [Oligoflexia bacterium]
MKKPSYLSELKKDAVAWSREDRNIFIRLPLLVYGIFLLWKVAFYPELFTPFDFLNLGIHELGHIVCMPFGEWIGIAGGSIAQVMAPLFGSWQFLRQRDYYGFAFTFAWLGESLGNLSVYIGDARKQKLPLANLFGGDPIHDWNYLLSHANRLNSDIFFASRVQIIGLLFVILFLWLGVWLLWNMRKN